MGKIIDLTGRTFGRLTVIERVENGKRGAVRWLCRCSCERKTEVIVSGNSLKSGDTKSCGCLQKESPPATKHGLRNSRIYNIWRGIKKRCCNPSNKDYHNYGGRGIQPYPAWHEFQPFYDYVSKLEHFNETGYSLDRINNNGNYEPENVRWADNKTQHRNKRNNAIVEYEGEQMCLKEAAEKSGINYGVLKYRHRAGDRGEYLFRPVDTRFSPKKH